MTTTASTSAATTKSSAASSILTALNGSSGIDWNTLATNLSAAQFATRSDQLTTKQDKLDKQISTASSLKSALLTLSTSIGDRGHCHPDAVRRGHAQGHLVA